MPSLRVKDIVTCVNPIGDLVMGHQYIVTSVTAYHICDVIGADNKIIEGMSQDRFRLSSRIEVGDAVFVQDENGFGLPGFPSDQSFIVKSYHLEDDGPYDLHGYYKLVTSPESKVHHNVNEGMVHRIGAFGLIFDKKEEEKVKEPEPDKAEELRKALTLVASYSDILGGYEKDLLHYRTVLVGVSHV